MRKYRYKMSIVMPDKHAERSLYYNTWIAHGFFNNKAQLMEFVNSELKRLHGYELKGMVYTIVKKPDSIIVGFDRPFMHFFRCDSA